MLHGNDQYLQRSETAQDGIMERLDYSPDDGNKQKHSNFPSSIDRCNNEPGLFGIAVRKSVARKPRVPPPRVG